MLFINKLSEKASNSDKSGLWKKITRMNDLIIDRMFGGLGGKYGRNKWARISASMYGKERTGSDGLVYGKFSSSSLPLQASGNYRDSHDLMSKTPIFMRYGSNFSEQTVKEITNAGLGDRVAMPNSDSAEYRQDLARVTSQHLNQIITEAFNETN